MKRPPRPSLFDIIFVIWAIVVPVGFGSRLINSDGDMARHIRLGGVALDQHALPGTDFFSYTRAGEPFIAFEWGSEVLYAAAYRAAGLAGVAVFALARVLRRPRALRGIPWAVLGLAINLWTVFVAVLFAWYGD